MRSFTAAGDIHGAVEQCSKGTPKPITITLEQRAGHKMVTKISGMEHYGIDPEDLAGQLKIKCASSTSSKEKSIIVLLLMK